MHPDLEFFLEEAFADIQPIVPDIGRVVVEPDYDATPLPEDKAVVAEELTQMIREYPNSGERAVPPSLRTLAKYIRRVTLRRDSLEGSWVEVAPPGNWI